VEGLGEGEILEGLSAFEVLPFAELFGLPVLTELEWVGSWCWWVWW